MYPSLLWVDFGLCGYVCRDGYIIVVYISAYFQAHFLVVCKSKYNGVPLYDIFFLYYSELCV